MYKSIFSLTFFVVCLVGFPTPGQGQITVNSNGNSSFDKSVSIDNNASIDGNTTILGSVKIGTTSHHSSRLYIYSNSGATSKAGLRAVTYGSGSVFHNGVQGVAQGSSGIHRGVFGHATGGSSANYGIYGSASGSGNWAGYFSGSVYTTGSYQGSDERLKKDIESIGETGMLTKLGQLDPKRYRYLNEEELKSRNLPALNAAEGSHYGLLAQEVEQVFPELVRDVVSVLEEESGEMTEDPDLVTTKAVNYQELTVVLLAAVQELQVRVEELEDQLN